MTVARGSKTLRRRDLVSGAAAGVVGGYVGTKVMNPVTTKLYEMAPEKDKQRDKAVSPGSPYRIGVQKAADLLGVSLTEEQPNAAAAAAPYTVGITGALPYLSLLRVFHLTTISARLAFGVALFLTFDDGLTP